MYRFCVQILLVLLVAGLSFGRPFTNTEGKTIEADIVSATATTVTLKIASGRKVPVKLETLSEADQKFVKNVAGQPPPRLRVTPNLVRSNRDDERGEYYYDEGRQVQLLTMKVEVDNDDAKAALGESVLKYVLVGRSVRDRNQYKILAVQTENLKLARQESRTVNFKTVKNTYDDGDYGKTGHKCIGYILHVKRKSDGLKVYSFASTPILEKGIFNIVTNLKAGDLTDENFLKPAGNREGSVGGSDIIEVE